MSTDDASDGPDPDRLASRSVVVATFHHRHQAETARGLLEGAGIRAAVSADDGGGAFGLPLTFTLKSFATVSVLEDDAEEAESILREAGVLEE